MEKTIKLSLKFERVTELINLLRGLDDSNRIWWDIFSEDFIQFGKWNSDELIALIESFESKINFKRLVRNKQIKWDSELLERFSNQPIWNHKELYQNMGVVNLELIDRFYEKWNWKWLGRYLVRRDASLELIQRYRDKWVYLPSEDWDVDVDNGRVTSAVCYLQDDSIFDNPHINWSNIENQEAFASEIENYKQHARNHAATRGYEIDEKIEFRQFDKDILRDLPFGQR